MLQKKEKQKVYRIYYSGNQIKCIREYEEERKPETIFEQNSHWLVIAVGLVVMYWVTQL